MNAIENAVHVNYLIVVIGVFTILFAVKEAIELIGYFKKKMKITTGEENYRESIEDRISILESHDKEQISGIAKISKCVEEIRRQLLDKEIDDIRWEILDFASALSAGRKFSKEQFDHVVSIHQKYDKILEANHMTNGLVDCSMDVILERYEYCLKHGFQ